MDILGKDALRFWDKVSAKNGFEGCWLWEGAKKPSGYGNYYANGKYLSAHRYSYQFHFGAIADGLLVMHKCDNPSCVNPWHLSLGSPQDNMTDMKAKGRAKGAHQGSEFSPMRKLNWQSVFEIRRRLASGETGRAIAKDFGVTEGAVSYIKSKKTWWPEPVCAERGVYLEAYA